MIQPTCAVATGTITVTSPVPGAGISYTVTGTAPVTAAITNGTGIFAGLTPGVYAVTTTNSDGCTSAVTVATINGSPETPAAPVLALIQPTCTSKTGIISVLSPVPGIGITYTIWGGEPVIASVTNGTGIFTGLPAGIYNITATSGAGCTSTVTVATITAAPETPDAPALVLTQPSCTIATGAILISSTANLPGTTYTLTGINPAVPPAISSTGYFAGLAPGVYAVSARNSSGCISEATNATITASPESPAAPTITLTQPTCTISTGIITVLTPVQGVGISFTLTGTFPVVTAVTNDTGRFTGITPGVYTITTSNSSGCSSPTTVATITAVPVTPGAPAATLIQPSCTVTTGTIIVTKPNTSEQITYTVLGTSPVMDPVSNGTGVFAGLNSGVYRVTTTNEGGCVSLEATYVISAPPLIPRAPLVGMITQPTCTQSTGSVILNELPEGLWTLNPGMITGSTTTITISGLQSGSHRYTVTNGAGCQSGSSAEIVINSPPEKPAPPQIGAITQPNCNLSTGSVVLSGLPSGTWIVNPGGITGSSASVTIGGLSSGTYAYTVTNMVGCQSALSANVIISVAPELPAAPLVGTITQPSCTVPAGSVVLSGLPSGTWKINPGGLTGSAESTTIAALIPGIYKYTVTNSAGCTSTASSEVLINPSQIILEALPTSVTCKGSSDGKIDLSVSCGSSPYVFEWTGPANFTSRTEDLTGLAGGIYHITVTDANGSTGSTSVTVNESAVLLSLNTTTVPETRKMSVDGTIILGTVGGSVNLTAAGGTAPFSYSWSGPNNFTADTEDLADVPSGTYVVVVTDANGCIKTVSAIVDVQVVLSEDETCVLFIPNVFTPNGDGIHDYFEISCLYNYSNAEIEIFNRNGNLLFKKNHYGNISYWGSPEKAFWNGRSENSLNFMGGELPVGTYYYILRLTNGKENVYTGFVFLGR